MQKVELFRDIRSNRANLGSLHLDGEELCKTLENPDLNNHNNISCIPLGTYKVIKYSSPKYPKVWEILDVPGRTHVLIHVGNTEANTEGCILVGRSYGFLKDQIAVLGSKLALGDLRAKLDDEFTLEICNAI